MEGIFKWLVKIVIIGKAGSCCDCSFVVFFFFVVSYVGILFGYFKKWYYKIWYEIKNWIE